MLLLFAVSPLPPLACQFVGVEHVLIHITLGTFGARDHRFRVASNELACVVRIAVLEARRLDVVPQVVKKRTFTAPFPLKPLRSLNLSIALSSSGRQVRA